jgi:capsular polysaccharide transport system ATP-binding protein
MIKLQNLTHVVSKDGEDVTVLDNLNAVIPTKGAFGILGIENAGKSTLMRLLSGFAKPQSGDIIRHARLSFPIGYEGIFKRNLSPRDNLFRFRDAYGQQITDIARYVSANIGLGSKFDVPLGKLPPGHQSRFVFIATYALPFDCYLVDERFAPNEPYYKAICQRMMEERAQANGIILATRRANIVQRFCTSAGILDKGKLVIYDNVEDAVQAFKEIEVRSSFGKLRAVTASIPAIQDNEGPDASALKSIAEANLVCEPDYRTDLKMPRAATIVAVSRPLD